MNQAYFENIRSQILSVLNDAKQQVCVAMAWFTSAELFESVKLCCNRGVKVKLILLDDVINWMPYAPDFNELSNSGAEIRVMHQSEKFMHNKFCIVDNNIVITGSYNWTYYAEVRNLENIVITDESLLVCQYQAQFDILWEKAGEKDSFTKLSFDEISQRSDVNLVELNWEIQSVEHVKNLPQKVEINYVPTFETIKVKDNVPYSAVNIGLHVKQDNDDNSMLVFIPKDQKLPFSNKKTLYNYEDCRENITIRILYGDFRMASQNTLLVEKPINEIIGTRTDVELQIDVVMQLDANGYLNVSVKCIESGRTLAVTTLNPKLVRYDD